MQLQHHINATDSRLIDYTLFLVLGVIWSSSFLLIKIAVIEVGPWTVAASRIAIAAVILVLFLYSTGGRLPREPIDWVKFTVIGVTGNILPFFLIGYGEQTVDSGMAAILMGVMPVATLVLAHLLIPDEPFTLRKGIGVAISFTGVVILVGVDSLSGLTTSTLAKLAVLGGALCYAVTTVFIRRTTTLSGPVMAAGSQTCGAVLAVPLAFLIEQPLTMQPTTISIITVIALGLFPSALATLLYFRLVKNLGAGRMSQVNYLIPVLGAIFGIVFLNEHFQWSTWVALCMVITGIAVISRGSQSTTESVKTRA
ncbi:MAG: hypothetical conserved integral membrane protein [marine bacterium B5-7]|nr:MAG: hypothetical conserved integral membrane protein [marine bacterium B5-7]